MNGVTSLWVKIIFIAIIFGVLYAGIMLLGAAAYALTHGDWPVIFPCIFGIFACVFTANNFTPRIK